MSRGKERPETPVLPTNATDESVENWLRKLAEGESPAQAEAELEPDLDGLLEELGRGGETNAGGSFCESLKPNRKPRSRNR